MGNEWWYVYTVRTEDHVNKPDLKKSKVVKWL